MNIAIVSPAPPYRGGIATHTSLLMAELTQNYAVLCINFSRQYPNFLFPGKTQYLDPPVYQENAERIIDSINPFSWRKAANRIIEFEPHVVLFRFWNPFFAPIYVNIIKRIKKKNPKIKICGLFDNLLPHEPKSTDHWLISSFLMELDKCIVQSGTVKNEIQSIDSNAVILKLFHPVYNQYGDSIEKSKARDKLIVKNEFFVLFFGLVRAYKGLDILIKATAELKKTRSDFQIMAVGECYEKDPEYLNLIESLDIGDVFSWKNEFIPDNKIPLYFSAADVIALPYKTASQSGIVQIATHFNKPVIVTNVGGLPEMVLDGKTGYIANPNDPYDFADKLNLILENEKLSKMSKEVNQFKQNLSWQVFTDKLVDFIR